MRLYVTRRGRYSSLDDRYTIDGKPGKWVSYFTPDGSAARLNKYPFKMFTSSEYICDYHKIIYNSPDGE